MAQTPQAPAPQQTPTPPQPTPAKSNTEVMSEIVSQLGRSQSPQQTAPPTSPLSPPPPGTPATKPSLYQQVTGNPPPPAPPKDEIPADEPVEVSTQDQPRAQKRIRQLIEERKQLEERVKRAEEESKAALRLMANGIALPQRNPQAPQDLPASPEGQAAAQAAATASSSSTSSGSAELDKLLSERFSEEDAQILKTLFTSQRQAIMTELAPVLQATKQQQTQNYVQQFQTEMQSQGFEWTPEWETALATQLDTDPILVDLKMKDPLNALRQAFRNVLAEVALKGRQPAPSLPSLQTTPTWSRPSDSQPGLSNPADGLKWGNKTESWGSALLAAKKRLGLS